MLKEIHEQPKAVKDTIGAYVKMEALIFPRRAWRMKLWQRFRGIYIVACGSAYHVGMVGKYVIEGLAKIPVEVDSGI